MSARPTTLRVDTDTISTAERWWAVCMLVSLSLHIPHLGLVPVGAAVALISWRRVRRTIAEFPSRVAGVLPPAALAAVAVGGFLCLALVGSPDGTHTTGRAALEVSLWLIGFPLMALGGLSALQLLGVRRGLFWIGTGALVGNVLYLGLSVTDPWKFVLSYPVCILGLLLTARFKNRAVTILAAIVLVLVFAVSFGGRSVGSAVAIAAVLATAFRQGDEASAEPRQERPALRRFAGVALLAGGALLFLLNAMRLGWLGQSLAEEYARQTVGGQNLLLGGRVEWNATFSLMAARPTGFGLGTTPSDFLKDAAIGAVVSGGGDPNPQYYATDVFAARTDLHSILADMWFHAGLAGLVLAAVLYIALARGILLTTFARWTPGTRAAALFTMCQACWDLAFSPMAQIDRVSIGVAVALFAVAMTEGARQRRTPDGRQKIIASPAPVHAGYGPTVPGALPAGPGRVPD